MCLASQDEELEFNLDPTRRDLDVSTKIPIRPSALVRAIRELYQQDAVG